MDKKYPNLKQGHADYPNRFDIAACYITDARDFLFCYRYLNPDRSVPHYNSYSLNARNFTDLRISVECTLKSIISLRHPYGSLGSDILSGIKACDRSIDKIQKIAFRGLLIDSSVVTNRIHCGQVRVSMQCDFDLTEFRDHHNELYNSTLEDF